MAKEQAFQFEKALDDLASIVEHMESGNLTLEDALKKFEQGVKLTKACQGALQAANQKVATLLDDGQLRENEPSDGN